MGARFYEKIVFLFKFLFKSCFITFFEDEIVQLKSGAALLAAQRVSISVQENSWGRMAHAFLQSFDVSSKRHHQ